MFIKNSGEQCMEKVRILRKRFFKKNQKEILELRKTINALRKKNKQTNSKRSIRRISKFKNKSLEIIQSQELKGKII